MTKPPLGKCAINIHSFEAGAQPSINHHPLKRWGNEIHLLGQALRGSWLHRSPRVAQRGTTPTDRNRIVFGIQLGSGVRPKRAGIS
jgi:hypothetical protein